MDAIGATLKVAVSQQAAARHPTSHKRHDDNEAGDGPRQTDPPSRTVPGAD
jgi:hypothetical protein